MIYTDHSSPYVADRLKNKFDHADLAPYGANILVSPVNIPPIVPKLIESHLEAKAQLIYFRSVIDWFHNDDVFVELEKMLKWGTYPQRVLFLYMEIDTSVKRLALDWQRRGGIAIIESPPADVAIQLKEMHTWLNDKANETKRLWSEVDSHPLQELESVSSQENLLAMLPNIGEKKAGELWAAYGGAGLAHIVHLLTQSVESFKSCGIPNVSGIGAKTNERIREFFGLPDDYEMAATKITVEQLKARTKKDDGST